jgi:RNA polymerase sigma factor (sigma-70 family)
MAAKLDDQECRRLIALGQAGDRRAYDQLIRLARPHIQALAIVKYRVRSPELEEVVPIAIWEAARRFDLSVSSTFFNFARWWIRLARRHYRTLHRGGPVELPVEHSHRVQKAADNGEAMPLSTSAAVWQFACAGGMTVSPLTNLAHQAEYGDAWIEHYPSAESQLLARELATVADSMVSGVKQTIFRRLLAGDIGTEIAQSLGVSASYVHDQTRRLRARLSHDLAATAWSTPVG